MERLFTQGRKSPYYKEMKQAFKKMNAEIYTVLGSEHPLLNETAVHLQKSGGKHLRPGFIFLGGHFGQYRQEQLMALAVSMEITHMATLIHDDVVDTAALRRGKPTVKALWGNEVSVYTGNYLLAKAMSLISTYKDPKLNHKLSEVALEMCRGELDQMQVKNRWDSGIDDYLKRIRQKTALLIGASCELGAYICKAEEDITFTLKSFGENLGMAFQITDDILDYSKDAKKFGKTLGGDIREGIITLPLLYAINEGNHREELKAAFDKEEKSEEEIAQIITMIEYDGGIARAKEKANDYTLAAKNCILSLPRGELQTCFLEIADFVLCRDI